MSRGRISLSSPGLDKTRRKESADDVIGGGSYNSALSSLVASTWLTPTFFSTQLDI